MSDFDKVIQGKIDSDTDFQNSLSALSEEEKAEAITKKREELVDLEYKGLVDGKTKAEQIAEDQKKRAKKAEEEAEALKAKKEEETLSTTDFYALQEAKVPKEDVALVQEAAKLFKTTIEKVLAMPLVQAQLADVKQKRETANATDTGSRGGGTGTKTDAEVLKEASEGTVPEPGSPEALKLYRARRGIK